MRIYSNNLPTPQPQPQTNFKAIMVPRSSQKRFMTALREECNSQELMHCLHTLEKEKNNLNHVIVEDLGSLAGQPCNGHLRADVNGKSYWNSSFFICPPTIPDFLASMSKKAGKNLDEPTQLRRKTLDIINKAERNEFKQNQKRWIKEGAVTEKENKHYLLGEIYKLINFRPKNI